MGKYLPGNEWKIPIAFEPDYNAGRLEACITTNGDKAFAQFYAIREKDLEKPSKNREKYMVEVHGSYHETIPDNKPRNALLFAAKPSVPEYGERVFIVVELILLTTESNQAQLQHKWFGDGYKQAILGLEDNVSQKDIIAISRGRDIIKKYEQEQRGGRPKGISQARHDDYISLVFNWNYKIEKIPNLTKTKFCEERGVSRWTLNRALAYVREIGL